MRSPNDGLAAAATRHSTEDSAPLLSRPQPNRGHNVIEDDSAQLLALGHKPELKRHHTKLSMLGLAFAILNSWTSLSASLSLALPSGGPTAALWGLVVAGVCNLCLAVSLAEFLSAYPTAGVRSPSNMPYLFAYKKPGLVAYAEHGKVGQYHWVAMISPPDWVPLLSWICGWINCSGWVFLVATGGSLASQLILGVVNLLHPLKEFVPTPYQMLTIYIISTLAAFSINAFANRLLPLFAKSALIWSVSGVTVISVTLLTCAAPDYQPAEFVFRKFINETGWPDGIAWSLGLLQGALALTGYDAVAHMIEEIPNPSRTGPQTMIYAVLIGTFTGFFYLMVLLFCMGDISEVISAPHGAVLALFYQATGSKAGSICLLVFPLICLFFGTITIVTTSSRMLYAFARDNGLPFSHQFSKIHPTLHVPFNALLLTALPVLLMGSLYLISTSALNAFLSSSVITLNLSYAFPVLLNVLTGRKRLPKDRSFKLGNTIGWISNIIGLVFVGITTVLFMLPPTLPVTRENMNYSFLVFFCIIMISTLAYIFGGRKTFHGPRMEVSESDEEPEQIQEARYNPGSALLSNLELDDEEDGLATVRHRDVNRVC